MARKDVYGYVQEVNDDGESKELIPVTSSWDDVRNCAAIEDALKQGYRFSDGENVYVSEIADLLVLVEPVGNRDPVVAVYRWIPAD